MKRTKALAVAMMLCCRSILGLIFLTCGPPPEADRSSGPVAVGWISPAIIHESSLQGALLAAEEINAVGGLELAGERRPLNLLTRDSGDSPEMALSHALELINRHQVVALLGLTSTRTALPVARIAEEHGVPMISILSSHPATTAGRRFVFRLTVLDSVQGRVLAEAAYGDLGARRAALLVDVTNAYSRHISDVFGARFEELGGEVAVRESFTEEDEGMAAPLERARAMAVDVIFLPTCTDFTIEGLRLARELGITVPVLGGDSWIIFESEGRPQGGELYFVDLWAPERSQDLSVAFSEHYHQRYGDPPDTAAALAYDAVQILAAAARRGGGSQGDILREALASLTDFEGVTGRYSFSGAGGNPRRSLFLRRIDEHGRLHLLREITP